MNIENRDKSMSGNTTEEITLREIILNVQEYYGLLKSSWILIILFSILGALALGGYTYLKEPIYPASLTFMVNEDNGGGGMGGASMILGQFGIGGAGSEYNLDKIVALAKSNKILEQSLLDTSYQPILANRLIDLYDFHSTWEESDLLRDFYFKNQNNPLAHNAALRNITNLVRGSEKKQGIAVFNYTEETGILKIEVKSPDSELSILLTEAIYDHLSRFYIKEATDRPKKNLKLLTERADSIVQELEIAEQKIASYEDRSQRLLLKTNQIGINKLRRNAQILAVMYAEVVKNKETSHFILRMETPFFQIIDRTFQPVPQTNKRLLLKFLIGGFLGAILITIWIIGTYIYHQVMHS